MPAGQASVILAGGEICTDKIDLTPFESVMTRVVAPVKLTHGRFHAAVVFELENVDIAGSLYLQIAASLIGMTFGQGVGAA